MTDRQAQPILWLHESSLVYSLPLRCSDDTLLPGGHGSDGPAFGGPASHDQIFNGLRGLIKGCCHDAGQHPTEIR